MKISCFPLVFFTNGETGVSAFRQTRINFEVGIERQNPKTETRFMVSGVEPYQPRHRFRHRRICLWQKRSESKDQPERVMAQILRTIIGLKEEVKRGMLPVKTITDAFNQGKCKEIQSQDPEFGLTYQRIGRILSAMGFAKGKVGSNSGILWDQENIERLEKIYGLQQTQEARETQETHTLEVNYKENNENSLSS